ncbi:GTP1/OBG family protein, putative [Babesia bigemina]|uniref:GTP1/OBG family protein, putative n=1 Tax=Babesia bigemina TaxID=5866 RepID=A0A061D951_BABBI|nr:GTP1/OBG family protein, putative [Babesia bigemina]CDR97073.1 GTP1/OBG family protein, putative [Babesia bigemina]|eukprot:XP_012769259.1 GTP1/OBG family protein, putative [Babesia bigemina]
MRSPWRASGVARTFNKDVAKVFGELMAPKHEETFPRYQTPFVDYLRVKCRGGHGGSPLPNVNRSQKLAGPGYGGHGGDVILKPTHLVESLLHIEETIKANNGGDAEGTSRGKHAKHTTVNVPLGVIVRKRIKTMAGYRSVFWHQFQEERHSIVVARGGKGGLGPSTFKKHDNRLPEVGETTHIELELRLINDVALIGRPNAGKTSLVSALTSYMTRIGPEEGSTTRPHVAVLRFVDGLDVRLMDLPPFSAENEQIYARILRHIYRTKVVAYVINAADDQGDPVDTLQQLRAIVKASNMYQQDKTELVVMTKCDMFHKEALYNLDKVYYKLRNETPHVRVVGTSATHRLGLQRLVNTLRELVHPKQVLYTPRETVESQEIKFIKQPDEPPGEIMVG